MLKHYIKFAVRNFRTNRVIFVGSLATLCLGALCISLLFSYVHNEVSMDDFHKREKDIYAVILQDSPNSEWTALTPSYFFDFDYDDFPEIEKVARVQKVNKEEATLFYKDLSYYPEGIIADNAFFEVFDFELLLGNREKALNRPDAVLLSEKYARKLFGNQNPIGKPLKIKYEKERLCTVDGIVKVPSNSSITFDFILPRLENLREHGDAGTDFILLKQDYDKETLIENLQQIGKGQPLFEIKTIDAKALDAIYFNEDISIAADVFTRKGDMKNLYVLSIIMLVILLISVFNFSSLQVISTNIRIKQSAVTRIHGAQEKHLLYKKIVEILLLSLLSVFIIGIGYQYCLPYFNNFTFVELAPPLWKQVIVIGAVLALMIVLSLMYTTMVSSRIPIIKGLKDGQGIGSPLTGRKTIVIFQYALTFVLIISSIIVSKQLGLMLNKDLGFTHNNIIRTKLEHRSIYNAEDLEVWEKEKSEGINRQQYINNELTSNVSIKNFSQGHSPLRPRRLNFKVKGMQDGFTTQNFLNVAPDYEKIFNLKCVTGRFFNAERDNVSTDVKRVVINEAAKRAWNIKDISKSKITTHADSGPGHDIIGVVKDFNYERLSVKPGPLVMFSHQDSEMDYFIQFHEGGETQGLQSVENLFNQLNPGETFKYVFVSDEVTALYHKERRLGAIFIAFTIIALLISVIGLFTIALYDTQKRKKEIGIRKVNGATVSQILRLLNQDFLKWVGLAFVIAVPISWYTMDRWLEGFAYKTTMSWWIFALAGIMTLAITLLTVSWQSFRAAIANPVESLREE